MSADTAATSSTASLSAAVLGFPRLVYEAHSTDYQTEAALRALVEDHGQVPVGAGVARKGLVPGSARRQHS